MAKASELRNLSIEELEDKLDKLKKELMQRRFESKTAKLERQSVIRDAKHDIARVLTVINEMKKRSEVKA